MDKDSYFAKFHQDLANRYNLTPEQVWTIRGFFLGQKVTREDILEWCKRKLKETRLQRSQSKNYYQRILKFLSEAPENVFSDIISLTPFDKVAKLYD